MARHGSPSVVEAATLATAFAVAQTAASAAVMLA